MDGKIRSASSGFAGEPDHIPLVENGALCHCGKWGFLEALAPSLVPARDDAREFWVRAEERNRETAKAYDCLGLADYEAMEAFVRYRF